MKRKKLLQIRVNETETGTIQANMQKLGFDKMSDYARTAMTAPSKLNYRKFQELLYEVNKIGVNLNQVLRAMHREGVNPPGLANGVDECRRLLGELLVESRKR